MAQTPNTRATEGARAAEGARDVEGALVGKRLQLGGAQTPGRRLAAAKLPVGEAVTGAFDLEGAPALGGGAPPDLGGAPALRGGAPPVVPPADGQVIGLQLPVEAAGSWQPLAAGGGPRQPPPPSGRKGPLRDKKRGGAEAGAVEARGSKADGRMPKSSMKGGAATGGRGKATTAVVPRVYPYPLPELLVP